jgi:hypothetical protein
LLVQLAFYPQSGSATDLAPFIPFVPMSSALPTPPLSPPAAAPAVVSHRAALLHCLSAAVFLLEFILSIAVRMRPPELSDFLNYLFDNYSKDKTIKAVQDRTAVIDDADKDLLKRQREQSQERVLHQ